MKTLQLAGVVVAILLIMGAPAMAQAPTTPSVSVLSGSSAGAGLGAAIAIIGAGYGFGRIGSAALEGMARQPEIAARIQIAMIIIAALLEGATFFALIICYGLTGSTARTF
jgi:F-type H+-transporting ATPase subunit c